MPYATRKMVQYMKEKGLNNNDENPNRGAEVVSGVEPNKKKIRELPSSVDPSDEVESPVSKVKSKSSGNSVSPKRSKSKTRSVESTKSKKSPANKRSPSIIKSKKKKSASGGSVKPAKSSSKPKVTVVKATTMALKPVDVDGMVNYQDMTYDEKKVKFIQTLLRSNVKRLNTMEASDPVKENQNAFNAYTIETKKEVAKGHSAKALYEAKHKDFADCLVVCKLYNAKSPGMDSKSSLFLRVLRHLGKEHPNIIQTWDVMSKGDTIYVFQELAPYGNMQDYITKKGILKEEQTQSVAKQIRMAMDFLGDMGVAHRAIRPSHVLLAHKDMQIKLTGFRSAIVYYDENKDEINFQPCLSLSKKDKSQDYQAPEVYGNPAKEMFDPITADVWSFGATLFNLLSSKYPYDSEQDNPKVGDEIQKNVLNLKVSKNALSVIGHMLTIESTKRLSVDKLKDHPWLKEK